MTSCIKCGHKIHWWQETHRTKNCHNECFHKIHVQNKSFLSTTCPHCSQQIAITGVKFMNDQIKKTQLEEMELERDLQRVIDKGNIRWEAL